MKTYYLTARTKTIMLFSNSLTLTIYSFIILYVFPFLRLQVLIGWIVIFGLISLLSILLKSSITLASNGIEYFQPFRTFKVEWEGIDRIGRRWFTDGLIIHSGYLVSLRNTFPSNIKAYSIPFPFYDFIPLSWFENNWRESELGQQIKQYAPNLFEKSA
jgi:hypothetical protein